MKIKINKLQFGYNETPVIKNISEEIDAGDFVAVVGPNGSGKSTLIKCLNGILKTKHGAVCIDNSPLNSYGARALAQKIAFVPQHEYIANPLTVFDTVLLGRKPYIHFKPSKKDLAIVEKLLNELDLADFALKNIDTLSGGQRQRVFIARALAQDPEVLLLDEPTANLDLKHQLEVLDLLNLLAKSGLTIVMALHDINLAIRYCSKTIMLKSGQIVASGGNEVYTAANLEMLFDIKVKLIQDNEAIFVIPTVPIKN